MVWVGLLAGFPGTKANSAFKLSLTGNGAELGNMQTEIHTRFWIA